MNWIKHNGYSDLKEGTIAVNKENEILLVGKINESHGINDEFIEHIVYYSEDYIQEINDILEKSKINFNNSNLKL